MGIGGVDGKNTDGRVRPASPAFYARHVLWPGVRKWSISGRPGLEFSSTRYSKLLQVRRVHNPKWEIATGLLRCGGDQSVGGAVQNSSHGYHRKGEGE